MNSTITTLWPDGSVGKHPFDPDIIAERKIARPDGIELSSLIRYCGPELARTARAMGCGTNSSRLHASTMLDFGNGVFARCHGKCPTDDLQEAMEQACYDECRALKAQYAA